MTNSADCESWPRAVWFLRRELSVCVQNLFSECTFRGTFRGKDRHAIVRDPALTYSALSRACSTLLPPGDLPSLFALFRRPTPIPVPGFPAPRLSSAIFPPHLPLSRDNNASPLLRWHKNMCTDVSLSLRSAFLSVCYFSACLFYHLQPIHPRCSSFILVIDERLSVSRRRPPRAN